MIDLNGVHAGRLILFEACVAVLGVLVTNAVLLYLKFGANQKFVLRGSALLGILLVMNVSKLRKAKEQAPTGAAEK